MMALCLVVSSSFAQKKAVNSVKSELKAKTPNIGDARNLIKGALENPETKDDPETWFVAGDIENKQFDLENTKEIIGQEPNKAVMYEALGGILPYFQKSFELDQLPDQKGKVKPKFTKKMQDILRANRLHYINAGLYYYENQNYPKAYENFKLYGDLPDLPIMEGVKFDVVEGPDSTAMQIRYYAGLAASLIPNHEAALEIYKEIKDNGYSEQEVYRNLAYEYTQVGDSASLEQILKEGVVKFPQDEYFLLNLINVSIQKGESEQASQFLKEAIKNDPNNSQLYDVLGQVYEEMKNFDEAAASFTKAVELNPENAEALSHLGRVYYNLGVEARAKADESTSNKAISEEETKKSLDLFRKAMPYFERAFKLNPDDGNAIYALRNIYYNLNMDEFEEMDAIFTKRTGTE